MGPGPGAGRRLTESARALMMTPHPGGARLSDLDALVADMPKEDKKKGGAPDLD